MKSTRNIQQYFLRDFGRQAIFGFALLLIVSFNTSFFLARREAASDLKESANAAVQAFHDRILEGDIRSVEPQLRKLFQIKENESVQILNSDRSRVYRSFAFSEKVKDCPHVGAPCFDGYFGNVQILFPVLSSASEPATPKMYLYVSKAISTVLL